MKSLKSFIKEVKKQLEERYGDKASVEITEVLKLNNKKETGLSIVFKDKETIAVPVIYIEDFYNSYKENKLSIDDCVSMIMSIREENDDPGCFENLKNIINDWNVAKSMVYPRVINRENNKELLESLVNEDYLDMSIIYILRGMKDKQGGYKSIKLTKELFKNYNIDQKTLKAAALKNLKNDGYRFERMEDILFRLMDEDAKQIIDSEDTVFESGNMYVLTNNGGIFGATGILDEELIRDNLKNTDAYIIPSSIHELIFMPAENVDAGELGEMIKSVNSTVLNECDILSDHAYYYSGVTQKIMCCA